MKTKILLGMVGLFLLLMAPISVAAATNTELIAILIEGLQANTDALAAVLKENTKLVAEVLCQAQTALSCP